MTTLLIFTSRTGAPASSLIPQTFNPAKLVIPKAPSLGLLLQEPRFGTYNEHIADENELAIARGETDRVRETIEWESLREQIEEFKREFIYSRIRAEEVKHGVCVTSPEVICFWFDTDLNHRFAAWLKFIDDYDGWEFKYLNPRGEVPPEAIVHRGRRKRGAVDKFREYLWKNPAGKGTEEMVASDEDDDETRKPDAETEG